MEGKPGDRMSLLAYLRRSSAQLDHWVGDETGFFHDSVEEGEEILGGEDYRELRSLEALPAWRARTRPADPDEVCLIDGRMRVLARLLVGKEVLLLAETAAGHVRWCREGGLSMGFSQRRPPRLRRIVAADKSVVDRLAEAGSDICFGERLIFSLAGSGKTTAVSSSGEAAYQAVCNVMRTLEAEEVRSLIDGGIPVIMDGTVHRGDPPFRSMVGPCGLVKRIRYLRLGNVPDNAPPVERELSCWAGESVFTLARGERTPFFCTELPGDPAQLRVFSYTRLVHPDPYAPWKGLVRLEVLAKAGEVVRLREAIGAFFDSLCNCLPNLSGDYVWKRLPENLFPMIALEEHLSLYFLPPVYMRTLFNRLIRRD